MYEDCTTPIAPVEKRQRGWDVGPVPGAPRKKQRPPPPSIMESPFARLTTIPSVRLFPPAVTLRLTVKDDDMIRVELIVNE
jgi:hypothetical protein